jgi:hypothetical protein
MRIASIVLSTTGLVAGYIWFYHWGPMRRVVDPAWYRQHSNTARWEECQACIYRSGWTHDTFGSVGYFGDKQWVQWMMDHTRPDDEIHDCTAGHKAHELRRLTNQDAGNTATAWLAWWEQNKLQSQEDWIRKGFRKYDLELHSPLTQANTIALLKLVPRTEEGKGGSPDYIQYNAFRWLRDSDFDLGKFAVKDIPTKDADLVFQGLLRFASLSAEYPKCDGFGVLKLGEPLRQIGEHDHEPMWVTTPYQILANTIVFIPLCTGALLLWLSFRMGHRRATTGEDSQTSG